MAVTHDRYNSIAIILHWTMAIAFLVMLGSGVAMTYFELDKSFKFQLYQWHKSGGILLLLASFLRISWRLISVIPKLPDNLAPWEKLAAKAGHYALYAVMFLTPLSGWLYVSSSVYGLPTIVFNLFEWPHFPGVEGNETIHEIAEEAHFILTIMFGILIAGHIGAVIKHAVYDHENLLRRMWWNSKG